MNTATNFDVIQSKVNYKIKEERLLDLFEKKHNNSLNSFDKEQLNDLEEEGHNVVEQYDFFQDFMEAMKDIGRDRFRGELQNKLT